MHNKHYHISIRIDSQKKKKKKINNNKTSNTTYFTIFSTIHLIIPSGIYIYIYIYIEDRSDVSSGIKKMIVHHSQMVSSISCEINFLHSKILIIYIYICMYVLNIKKTKAFKFHACERNASKFV